jgi:uncharacterized protein YqeY
MSILAKIETDFKAALKSQKEPERSVLRMLKTAISNKEIEKKRAKLTDNDILEVLRREVKSRQDAIADYKKGGRADLATKEADEIKIVEKYLPAMLDKQAVTKTVQAVIKEIKVQGPQDFGKVMGQAMEKLKGQADGQMVSEIVKQELNK